MGVLQGNQLTAVFVCPTVLFKKLNRNVFGRMLEVTPGPYAPRLLCHYETDIIQRASTVVIQGTEH